MRVALSVVMQWFAPIAALHTHLVPHVLQGQQRVCTNTIRAFGAVVYEQRDFYQKFVDLRHDQQILGLS